MCINHDKDRFGRCQLLSWLVACLFCSAGCDLLSDAGVIEEISMELLPIETTPAHEFEVVPSTDAADIERWSADFELKLTKLAAFERLRQIDLILAELQRMQLERTERTDREVRTELVVILRATDRWKAIRTDVVRISNSNF